MSEENRKNNTTCQFLVKYKDMVTILFEFINASRIYKYTVILHNIGLKTLKSAPEKQDR